MTRCVSFTGVVSEPQDERQTPAAGHDLASPCRPGLLHLHDEPRGGHGEPALPLSITPAPTLLLPPGCRGRLSSCRHPFLNSPALSRWFPGAVSSLPEAGAPVRLQTPFLVPRSDSRPRSRRNPVFLLGVSLQSVKRYLNQALRLGLRLLPNKQD